MDLGPCNLCINGFKIIPKNVQNNDRKYKLFESSYLDNKKSLEVNNHTKHNEINNKHFSYDRYLSFKKGCTIKIQYCKK